MLTAIACAIAITVSSDTPGRHEKLRGEGIGLPLNMPSPVIATGGEQVKIAERAMSWPIGDGLMGFDEEVSELVGNREPAP